MFNIWPGMAFWAEGRQKLELFRPPAQHTGQLRTLQPGLGCSDGELVCNIHCAWCQETQRPGVEAGEGGAREQRGKSEPRIQFFIG